MPPRRHFETRRFNQGGLSSGNGQINLRCLHKRYFAALLPVLKPDFDKYDSILYVDMDVMPAPDLKQNIFDLAEGHIMMSEEFVSQNCEQMCRARSTQRTT